MLFATTIYDRVDTELSMIILRRLRLIFSFLNTSSWPVSLVDEILSKSSSSSSFSSSIFYKNLLFLRLKGSLDFSFF